MTRLISLILLALLPSLLTAEDRPNILWITSEDNASHWLGCYGNTDASTPRIDTLASTSLRFTHAYSNGPVCAVARSTILNGAYATTQGTQHMRSRHPIPTSFKAHVTHLRAAGYYCTNNSKTDYNFAGNDNALWDESSPKAHYRNRPADKPFFAIFNLTTTHESQLFPQVVATNRKNGSIPKTTRLDPAKITVPPHLPDLPEVRTDIATYHDCLSSMDRQVGKILDELEKQGLADNTIIFHYADHGGPMARGKRYLHDTGVRIPLIIHFPEKWQHLSPFRPGTAVNEPVAFVDLAPTLLSLCDLKTPEAMQGRPFLGKLRQPPAPHALIHLYADRFDEVDGMRRGLTDGNFKYIRCFSPHLPAAPYCTYPLGQPSWTAWKNAATTGKLSPIHQSIWNSPQPVEMLFDLKQDPWEIHNLATDPTHAEKLNSFRKALAKHMLHTRDTSIIPESLWPALIGNTTIHDFVRSPGFDYETTLTLALNATSADPSHLPAIAAALTSQDPTHRYWAATGCIILAKQAAHLKDPLTSSLTAKHPILRITAAEALIAIGQTETGTNALIRELDATRSPAAFQTLVNTITRLQLTPSIPNNWPATTLADPKSPPYKKAFARTLSN